MKPERNDASSWKPFMPMPHAPRDFLRSATPESGGFRRKLLLEALEERILLSADPFAAASAIAASQLYDQAHAAIAEQALDPGAPQLIGLTGSALDTLVGASGPNLWETIGADTVRLNGETYAGVANLVGAAGSDDIFLFQAGGSLTGAIHGAPGGGDVLDYSSILDSVAVNAPAMGDVHSIDFDSLPTSGAGIAIGDGGESAGTGGQTVFLSLDGAGGVDYDGPVHIADLEVIGFAAPAGLEGQDSEIVATLVGNLENAFAGSGIAFTTEQPTEGEYSTIYIGGSGDAFSAYGVFWGLAEKVDVGNRDRGDIAFVFSENISAQGMTAQEYGAKLGGYAAHELGHLLGFEHAHESGEDAGPLAEVAFDPKVHVEIGDDAVDDVLSDDDLNGIPDGKVTIEGNEYSVHPKLVAALQNHLPYYNAGAVAGDGFPDVVMGQFAIHPIDHGTWLARVLDMAWAAQNEPWFTEEEKSQILAWSYGFLTHSAGDHWAHTLVNQFAEGVAPGFFAAAISIPGDQRDLANMLRHFMTEAYIADALEGVDSNRTNADGTPNRKAIFDDLGNIVDVSDDTTPGIPFEAPVRFIYDALIQPFPNDPTAIVEMAWKKSILGDPSGTLTIEGNSFVRSEGKWGPADSILPGTPGDGFKVGHKITVSGFSNAANNGTFIVKAVTDTHLTVDATLVNETASGDETIKVFVPKTEKTAITVNDATNSFVRAKW